MTAVTQLTMTPKTSLGRRKATQERAFVLNVGLAFRSQGVADGFIKEWGKAADYCLANEDFLFAYELAQSDPELTRTPRGPRLRWARTGYAYQPPALGTYRRRRAACPQGRAYCTHWVRVPASGVPYVPRTVAPQVGSGSAQIPHHGAIPQQGGLSGRAPQQQRVQGDASSASCMRSCAHTPLPSTAMPACSVRCPAHAC